MFIEGRAPDDDDDDNEKHHTLSPHTDVRCSIFTKLCTVVEEVRAIISPQCFSDPINSLAARGKNEKNQPPQPVSKNNTGRAAALR